MPPLPGHRLVKLLTVLAILLLVIPPAAADVPVSEPLTPATPAPAPQGLVSFTSEPVGAAIHVSGSAAPAGTTNAVLSLPPGEYPVTLKMDGYVDYAAIVTVHADALTTLDATLEPILPAGSLSVTSRPADAKVYVDGAYRGLTPVESTEETGTHVLLLTRSGYEGHAENVTIAGGSTTFITVSLEPSRPAGKAFIEVSSTPTGARVYLDGVYGGTTPVTINAVPRSHELRLELEGYRDYTGSVITTLGSVTPVDAVLEPADSTTPVPTPREAPGSISVISSPNDAYVFVDNEMRGITPVTVPDLSPGPYIVRVSKQGYNDSIQKVPVTAGQSITVSVALVPYGKGTPGFGAAAGILSVALLGLLGRLRRQG